jgi:hypothetical protein
LFCSPRFPLKKGGKQQTKGNEVEKMVECGYINDMEFKRVASEATARMKGGDWSFKRAICIYETNYCTGCMRCADEDLEAEARSNYMKAVF